MFSYKQETKEASTDYPRVIWTEQLEDGTVSVVDYSAKSLALFAFGSWDRKNIAALTEAGAMYNERLKKDSVNKAPGWVFSKSKPESMTFLNTLTGLVVLELAPAFQQSYKPRYGKTSTPIDSLSSFCIRTKVTDFEYISQVLPENRYGIYGPTAQVDLSIKDYLSKHPGSSVLAELTFGGKKTVILA